MQNILKLTQIAINELVIMNIGLFFLLRVIVVAKYNLGRLPVIP